MSRNRTLFSIAGVALLVGLASLVATGAIGRTPPSPRATTPPTLDLSGSWEGLSTGPFNGYVTVTLTQTGKALDGTVTMSSPTETIHVIGELSGNRISFGAAGVVTYNGTLSASTISGSYTDLATGKAGTWSATCPPDLVHTA